MSANLSLNSAQQKLFDANRRLVTAAVNRFHRRITRYGQGDPDDLRQELEIALARAAQSYKPAGGASLQTYASRCLDNAARDYIRKLKRPTNSSLATPSYDAFGKTTVPITLFDRIEANQAAAEQCIGLNDDDDDNPVLYEYGPEVDQAVAAIKLSGIERATLLLNLKHDLDYAEIAHVFGIKEALVIKAGYKAREKLRVFGKKGSPQTYKTNTEPPAG